jgi:hypothetical protein
VHDEYELNLDDLDFNATPIQYFDIEVNDPVSEEDLRYAELEQILFKQMPKIDFANF